MANRIPEVILRCHETDFFVTQAAPSVTNATFFATEPLLFVAKEIVGAVPAIHFVPQMNNNNANTAGFTPRTKGKL